MIHTNSNIIETSTYWDIIKDVKDEVKIRLITLLSESLSRSVENKKRCDRTEDFITKFYGAWKDSDSAEDIIQAINKNKSCKPPVSFD